MLFPLVALAIASVIEGYRWTAPALAGLALVMAGNVLIFRQPLLCAAVTDPIEGMMDLTTSISQGRRKLR